MKEKLKELTTFLNTTDLRELTWERGGVTIHLARAARPAESAPVSEPVAEPALDDAVAAPASEPEKKLIRSTMVGTFYRADSKNRPPLVVEGTLVSAGQPVAAVEAMKIMKDVLAPTDCRIVKALVDNGHPVEYGQPLFQVEDPV